MGGCGRVGLRVGWVGGIVNLFFAANRAKASFALVAEGAGLPMGRAVLRGLKWVAGPGGVAGGAGSLAREMLCDFGAFLLLAGAVGALAARAKATREGGR